MDQHYCQSCGMPMVEEAQYGSEAGGAKSVEYCVYCYEDGAFKQPDMSLEQMVEVCVPFLKEQGMPEKEARTLMEQQLPHLKRWRTASQV